MLNAIAELEKDNPRFHYLMAEAIAKAEVRDFKEVVTHLRKAIDLAESLNWDVSFWQKRLEQLTTGSIRITETY
jgi:hypothetical protein